ncbi:MAG: hypothetical protein ACR2M3_08350 [Thermomicrobiales bacterium]
MRHHSRFMRLIAVCAMLGSFFTSTLAATPVGAASSLSVVFDSDSYQGVPLYAFALELGQHTDAIVVRFRNTSRANTLYQTNVFLAAYTPDTDQPGSSPFGIAFSRTQTSPLWFRAKIDVIQLDNDCPPGALCSFTYLLLPPPSTGYYQLDWRVALLHPDGSFGGWLNTPDGSPTYEEYFINVV